MMPSVRSDCDCLGMNGAAPALTECVVGLGLTDGHEGVYFRFPCFSPLHTIEQDNLRQDYCRYHVQRVYIEHEHFRSGFWQPPRAVGSLNNPHNFTCHV